MADILEQILSSPLAAQASTNVDDLLQGASRKRMEANQTLQQALTAGEPTWGESIAQALVTALPALVGKAIGGTRGAMAGGTGGIAGYGAFEKQQKDSRRNKQTFEVLQAKGQQDEAKALEDQAMEIQKQNSQLGKDLLLEDVRSSNRMGLEERKGEIRAGIEAIRFGNEKELASVKEKLKAQYKNQNPKVSDRIREKFAAADLVEADLLNLQAKLEDYKGVGSIRKGIVSVTPQALAAWAGIPEAEVEGYRRRIAALLAKAASPGSISDYETKNSMAFIPGIGTDINLARKQIETAITQARLGKKFLQAQFGLAELTPQDFAGYRQSVKAIAGLKDDNAADQYIRSNVEMEGTQFKPIVQPPSQAPSLGRAKVNGKIYNVIGKDAQGKPLLDPTPIGE